MADCPPQPTGRHYLARDHLADLVREYQRTGHTTDALGVALVKIAGGVWDRYQFTTDRDEFVQDVALHLLGNPLKKADCSKHLFNFFTTCAIRFGHKLRDKAACEHRRFREYAQHLSDMREEIPERE